MMKFKTEAITLGCVAAALAIVFAATLIWSPDRVSARQAAYSWSNAGTLAKALKIDVNDGNGTSAELTRQTPDSQWMVNTKDASGAALQYPALKSKVDDLFTVLEKKAAFPIRSTKADNMKNLGLDPAAGKGKTIKIYGSNDASLLNLVIGNATPDQSGDVYLALAGSNTARSGDANFDTYLVGAKDWYDLRCFPDYQNNGLGKDKVQSVKITLGQAAVDIAKSNAANNTTTATAGTKTPAEPQPPLTYTLTREKSGVWSIDTSLPAGMSLDNDKADQLVQNVLDASGTDFVTSTAGTSAIDAGGSVTITTTHGQGYTLNFGLKDSAGDYPCTVTSNPANGTFASKYIFAMPVWNITQLQKDASYFGKQDTTAAKKTTTKK
jgi:hypothetical protein